MSETSKTLKTIKIDTVKDWLRSVFNLSDSVNIEVEQTPFMPDKLAAVDVSIMYANGTTHNFNIDKKLEDVVFEDIEQLRKDFETHLIKHNPVLGRILRLLGMWFGFSGVFMMFSVCPVCGQPGCIVGVGFASVVGAFFTGVLSLFRSVFRVSKK